MRTKITVHRNTVTVERDDYDTGERTTTTYFVPYGDGSLRYVRILDDAGRYPQVCEELGRFGSTLMATPETLPDVIRRELRRRQASDRRCEQKLRGY